MTEASEHLLCLGRRVYAAYSNLPTLRAFMITGSAAEGKADFYSDLDMTAYHEELPSNDELVKARLLAGGGDRIWLLGDRADGSFAESFILEGVEVQIGHATLAAWERDMDLVLEKLEVDSPLQKAFTGVQICVPLAGEELVQAWRDRLAHYPDGLQYAMVEKHLTFFPLWGLETRMGGRDATIWTYQSLVESCHNILAILAGLNRLYFTTFQFKRMASFVSQMGIAPAGLASRMEGLFTSPPREAAVELERLVSETLDLVDTHLPEIDTSQVRKRIGWRQQPWSPPSS